MLISCEGQGWGSSGENLLVCAPARLRYRPVMRNADVASSSGRELAEETSSDAHVRKLTAEKKYRDAWLEGLELCRRIAAWPRDAQARSRVPRDRPSDGTGSDPLHTLPTPLDCATPARVAAPLVVGAVMHMALSAVELLSAGDARGPGGADPGRMVCSCAPAARVALAWLAQMDISEASKHADQLFRLLYKGSLGLLARTTATAPPDELAACLEATVSACASSPSASHTAQVAVRLADAPRAPPAAAAAVLRCALDAMVAPAADRPSVADQGRSGERRGSGKASMPPLASTSHAECPVADGDTAAEDAASVAESLVRAACLALERADAEGTAEVGIPLLTREDLDRLASMASITGGPAVNIFLAAAHLVTEAHRHRSGSARPAGISARLLAPAIARAPKGDGGRLATPAGMRAFSALRRAALAFMGAAADKEDGVHTARALWAHAAIAAAWSGRDPEAAAPFLVGALSSAVAALKTLRRCGGGLADLSMTVTLDSTAGVSGGRVAPRKGSTSRRQRGAGAAEKENDAECASVESCEVPGVLEALCGGVAGAFRAGQLRAEELSWAAGTYVELLESGDPGERPWPLRLLRDPSVSALHPIRSASFHLRRVADTLAQVCVPGSPQGAPQGAASGVESWADVRRKIAECWAALEACCSSDSNSAARGGTAECHDQSKLQADAPADASLDGDLQPNAPLAACWACALGCLAEVLVPQRGLRDSDADAGAGFEKNIPCGPQEWSHAALSAAEALHARQRTPSEDTSGSEGGGHACAAAQPSASSGAPSPPSKGGRGWAARPSRCSLEGALPALLLARDAAAAAGDAGAAQAMGRTVALVASCGATSTHPATRNACLQALSGSATSVLVSPWSLGPIGGALGYGASLTEFLSASHDGIDDNAAAACVDRYPACLLSARLAMASAGVDTGGGSIADHPGALASLASWVESAMDASRHASASGYVHLASAHVLLSSAHLAAGDSARASRAASRACGLLTALATTSREAAGAGLDATTRTGPSAGKAAVHREGASNGASAAPVRPAGGLSLVGVAGLYCGALLALSDAQESMGRADEAQVAAQEALGVASSLPVAIRDALTLACHLRIETVLVRSLGSTAALLGPDAGTRLHADATHDDSSCAPASRGTAEWPGSAPRQACGWLLRAQALSAKAEGAVLREEPQEALALLSRASAAVDAAERSLGMLEGQDPHCRAAAAEEGSQGTDDRNCEDTASAVDGAGTRGRRGRRFKAASTAPAQTQAVGDAGGQGCHHGDGGNGSGAAEGVHALGSRSFSGHAAKWVASCRCQVHLITGQALAAGGDAGGAREATRMTLQLATMGQLTLGGALKAATLRQAWQLREAVLRGEAGAARSESRGGRARRATRGARDEHREEDAGADNATSLSSLVRAFALSRGCARERAATGALLAAELARRGRHVGAAWAVAAAAGAGQSMHYRHHLLTVVERAKKAGAARDDDDVDARGSTECALGALNAGAWELPASLSAPTESPDVLGGSMEADADEDEALAARLEAWGAEALGCALRPVLAAADVVVAVAVPPPPGQAPLEALLGPDCQEGDRAGAQQGDPGTPPGRGTSNDSLFYRVRQGRVSQMLVVVVTGPARQHGAVQAWASLVGPGSAEGARETGQVGGSPGSSSDEEARDPPTLASVLWGFGSVLRASAESMRGAAALEGEREKRAWWSRRVEVDAMLSRVLRDMGEVLGAQVAARLAGGGDDSQMGQGLASRMARLQLREDGDTDIAGTREGGDTEEPPGASSRSVVLVLGHPLDALPWESVPALRHGRRGVYRMPSAPLAAAAAARLGSGLSQAPGESPALPVPVDASHGVCVVNPGGDLDATQSTFEPWLSSIPGWTGHFGPPPPDPRHVRAEAADAGLFVYMGHGAGEHVLGLAPTSKGISPTPASVPASVLVGCSSARMRPRGLYAPSGPLGHYLAWGAPVVVGTLWDVTDRDIDRFAARLLRGWVGPGAKPEGCAAAARDPAGEGLVVEAVRDAGRQVGHVGHVSGVGDGVAVMMTPAPRRRAGRLQAMGLATPAATPGVATTVKKSLFLEARRGEGDGGVARTPGAALRGRRAARSLAAELAGDEAGEACSADGDAGMSEGEGGGREARGTGVSKLRGGRGRDKAHDSQYSEAVGLDHRLPSCPAVAVTDARGACRLARLIGAAPVCYGLPAAVHRGAGPAGKQAW